MTVSQSKFAHESPPVKISQSIQRKVFVIFGSFTLLLTLVYSGINILIAYVVEDEVLEKVLAYEAHVIEKAFQEKGEVIQPRLDYMKLYLDPEKAPSEIAHAYKNKTLTSEVFTENQVHYHIQFLHFDKNTSALLVAEVTSFLTVTNASNGILLLFLFVFAITIVLSLLFAYHIAKKTTRPISILTKEVMLKQSQKQALVFSAKQTPDEIGYLAHVIDTALNDSMLNVKRESDFNRDVSHELRTPLTVLNNTLSLAGKRPLSTSDVADLKRSVSEMNHIVKILLILARSESIEFEVVPVRALLEDCVLSLHAKLVDETFDVNLDVPDDFKLFANRQLLTLLVNNLVDNAIQHGSGKGLLIRLENKCIHFENRALVNIPLSKIDKLTEKNVKQLDSDGLGQGLYLVKRIVETLNWQCEIKLIDGVFRFSVCFEQ
jgi:signal transduction histidine kinase